MAGLKTTRRVEPRRPQLSAPAFVGRAPQRETLQRALSHPPAVVLVEGEAGIGKTRLVRECLAAPVMRERRALVGVCPPYREPYTLAPVVDALRQSSGPVACPALTGLAGALRPLFPEWAAELPPAPEPLESAKAARYRLFRALAELVGQLGVSVLVMEDVHWADEASLEFLLFLATRQRNLHDLSLVVTYRPEDVPEASLLRRLSSGLPAGTIHVRVSLPPLDVAEAAELASSMLGGEQVSPTFAESLHEGTDGLPLAVEESVRLLGDRSDLVRRNGRWVRQGIGALQVPPTVRDSTLERAQRLGPAPQAVLRAAAVLAVPADESILAAVARLPEPAVRAALARAMTSGLLHDTGSGRIAFRHVLSATAVYEAMPAPQRRSLHERAGGALEMRQPTPTVELTRHFREANDLARWSHYAERSADLAIASSDHLAAVDLLDDLLASPQLPGPDRVRLAKRAGQAALSIQAFAGDRRGEVVRTLRTVRDSAGLAAPQRAEIGNLLGRLLNQVGETGAAFAELARAIPDLADQVEAARSMNLLGWPRAGPWPAAAHLRWLRRADALSAAAASPADRLGLMVDRAAALLQLGSESGWALVSALPAEVSDNEERYQLARGYLNIGDVALLWGRYGTAGQLLNAALALTEEGQLARVRDGALANLAYLDWVTGAWEGLDERVAALADMDDTDPEVRQDTRLVTGLLHAARGKRQAAEEQLRLLAEEMQRRGAASRELAPAAALARLWLADGKADHALALTDEPMRTVTLKRIWVWAGDIAPVRVEALARVGSIEEARRLVAAFATGLRGRNAPAPRAALATCRAILAEQRGDYRRAAVAFARAAKAWQALPRPYEAMLARERRAGCLLACDRDQPGVAELWGVLDGLAALGATGDADRVAMRLRERGLGVVRSWRGGRRGYGDQLSPRELEVVRLVVAGKTNRQIARTLSKAPGTVAEQLRSAMRKLGASSRTGLAVNAVEAGVVSDGRGPD